MKKVELIHPKPVFHLSRLLWAIVVVFVVLTIIESLLTNPNYRWDVVWSYLFHPNILTGIRWTLILTVAAMLIGIVLAVTMAIMRQSTNPILRGVAWFYIWFFRGTPIYTQLLFWGLLPTLYESVIIGIPFGPALFTWPTEKIITSTVAAICGLGLNEGAYLAEIVRSGLNSVDKGQSEAATALGMKRGQIMRRIVIPQAMRVIIPPTGNETISMLKTTSLVIAVPFTLELTYAATTIGNRTFLPVPLLITAAIWYLLITSILMIGQYYLERYFAKGFDSVAGPSKKKNKKIAGGAKAEVAPGAQEKFLDVTP